ncbi:hypothetical protein STEG23_019949 [Scotinomys teguina]
MDFVFTFSLSSTLTSDLPHSYRGFPFYLGTLLSSTLIVDLPHSIVDSPFLPGELTGAALTAESSGLRRRDGSLYGPPFDASASTHKEDDTELFFPQFYSGPFNSLLLSLLPGESYAQPLTNSSSVLISDPERFKTYQEQG